MKQQSLVAQRIVCESLLKKGGTLKVYITQKMLSDAKQLTQKTRRVKPQVKSVEKKQRISKEIKDVQAAEKVALESASKVAHV